MTTRTTLRVGKTLLVNTKASSTTSSTETSSKDDDSTTTSEVKHYKVKKGDTLGSIANRNGLSLKQLCTLNNITAKTTLSIGKTLRVS